MSKLPMNLLFASTARFVRRFRKTLIVAGVGACAVMALDWATSPPPDAPLEQAGVRVLNATCAEPELRPPEDWDRVNERYYVRQRPAGAGHVTVTLWGYHTTSEYLAGIVKQEDGRRLLVRPTFKRASHGAVHPACVITFGLEIDFTGLSEGAYSVGIAPTPLERLLD